MQLADVFHCTSLFESQRDTVTLQRVFCINLFFNGGKQDLHDHTWQDMQDKSILQIMPAFRRSYLSCFFVQYRGAKTVIDRNILQNLREHRPALYERQKMFVCLLNLNCAFPEIPEKCHLYPGYILGTSELEINGKMSALTQYFTWLSWDETENVIDRMERCSKIMVFHHDIFQIEETLKDVAKLFEQAALWNPTTNEMRQLKDLVGLFRYELAHAMPFIRGSAAVGEILEASLYWFHGFLNFRHSKPGDLEALTSMLLTDFMETYHGMVSLESRGPSSSAI